MKKYDIPTIKMTAIIFGLFAVLTWLFWGMATFGEWDLHNLGLFPLGNALSFGCLFFISLHRIIRSVQFRLEEYERRIQKLENHMSVTKET